VQGQYVSNGDGRYGSSDGIEISWQCQYVSDGGGRDAVDLTGLEHCGNYRE
jgi:hypothetical protein